MTVSNILQHKGSDVVSVSANCSLQEAATILATKRIGAIMVLSGDEIEGVLSERDLVRGIADGGGDCLKDTVASVMTPSVITCSPSDTIKTVTNTMSSKRIRHLPVVEDGKLVGMISIGDVVKAKIAKAELEAEALKTYIGTVS